MHHLHDVGYHHDMHRALLLREVHELSRMCDSILSETLSQQSESTACNIAVIGCPEAANCAPNINSHKHVHFACSTGEVTEGEVEGNGFHSGSTLGPEAQAAGKRLRFTSAADSNGGTSVHSSMSQIVSKLADVPEWPQGLGMSDALIDTMSMRCGVCEAVPLRQGVAHVFKDSMSRYRHFMSHEVILTVLLAVVQRQDSVWLRIALPLLLLTLFHALVGAAMRLNPFLGLLHLLLQAC